MRFSFSLATALVVLSYGGAEANSAAEQQAINACIQKNANCGCVSSMECHINCSPAAVEAACRDKVRQQHDPRQRRRQ
jgi:hypothetical protein